MNETVAREVVKDLVRGDVCKQLLIIKDKNIKNLQEQNTELVKIIKIKDEILSKKDDIIIVQDKTIGWFKKPEIHGYLGIQPVNSSLVNPYIYGTLLLEFSKFSMGGQYFIQTNNVTGYGIILEYKLF